MLAFSARAPSLAFLFLGVLLLALCRDVLIYLVVVVFVVVVVVFLGGCSKAFLSLMILLISAFLRAHFS